MMKVFHQKLLIPNVAPYALQRAHPGKLFQTISTVGRAGLLIAPTGSGKTTELVHWARSQPPNVTISWYSLDRDDRTPLVFLTYLLTALLPHCPALRPVLEHAISARGSALPPTLVEEVVATLAAHSWSEHLLILDNLHELVDEHGDTGQPICELIDLMIRYTSIRVMMAARCMLRGFIRMRVQGRIQVVESSALAFSDDDILALASSQYALALTSAQALELCEWSHGWPTAIVLALDDLLSDNAHPNQLISNLSLTSSTTHLFTFLEEQIFAPLPQPLQAFLRETSVLDDLTVARCDALRSANDSSLLLTDALGVGVFLTDRAGRLTYPEFFSKFLQQQLWKQPAQAYALIRRAAILYQESSQYQLALASWFKIDDLEAATALVLAEGPKLRTQGDYTTVLGWIKELRARGVQSPKLLLFQVRIATDLADWNMAFVSLQLALASGIPEVVAEAHLLEVIISCIRGEITHVSDLLAAISVETLPPQLRLEGYKTASRVAWNEGRVEAAIALLKQALAHHANHPSACTDANELPQIYDMLGTELIAVGDYALAVHYLRRADAAWQAVGNERRRATTLNNLGVVATEEGRLDDARVHLEEALALASRSKHHRCEPLLFCSLGDVALIQTRLELAQMYYVTAYQRSSRQQMLNEQVYSAAGAWRVAVLMGNEAECTRWRRTIDHLSMLGAVPYAGSIAVTRALAAENELEILKYLDESLESPVLAAHDRAQVLLLRVQCAYQQGGWTASIAHWQALETTSPKSHLDRLLQIQVDATPGLLAAFAESSYAQRLRGVSNASTQPHWEVLALGGFSMIRSGCDYAKEVRPIDQLVIIRLLEAGAVGLPTLKLWEDVWGDQPYSSDALRQSLSRIRRTIGVPVQLRLSHCLLQLDWSELSYDVALFEVSQSAEEVVQDASAATLIGRLLGLYRGAFLAHLNSESAWLAQRRATLRRRQLYLREKLALAVELDDPHQALQICCAILNEDSCREIAAACAMRSAAHLGDRALAIAIYRQVCIQLVNDLGTDPSPILKQIYRDIA